MRRALKNLLRRAVPDRLKSRLFTGALAIMSDSQRDHHRRALHMASMPWSLGNLRKLGFSPGSILDVGAFEGHWTTMIRDIFPEPPVLMVEAQPAKKPLLEQVARGLSGSVRVASALLGPQPREAVVFHAAENASSMLHEQSATPRRDLSLPMTTLDRLVAEYDLPRPHLLKLDVQGYELEVLAGGQYVLRDAEVVVMEVSLLPVIRGAPLLAQVVQFMDQHGLAAYDICSFIRRPLDQALWQTDMIFVRGDSVLRRDERHNA